VKFKICRREILIFLFFIFLTLLATYPLVFRMRSGIYGYPGDSFTTLWKFWWLKHSIWQRHISPFFCSYQAAPFGVNLKALPQIGFHFYFVPGVLFFFNEILTYNIILLLGFFLSAVTMYFLVYHFTRDKVSSMVSGIIYAFCPFHSLHAMHHLSLASTQWMPLYLLTLFKLSEVRNFRNIFFCALAFSLVVFFDYYYGYLMAIATIVFLFFQLGGALRKKVPMGEIIKNSRIIFITLVIVLIFILPFTYNAAKAFLLTPKHAVSTEVGYVRPFHDLFSYSARLFDYLLPSGTNPLLGKHRPDPLLSPHALERTLYLGWVGIFLSIIAFRTWRRKSRRRQLKETPGAQGGVSFFCLLALVGFLFSLAPYLRLGNYKIFFPSYFMYKLVPMFRVYARFGVLIILSVSVLAGIGLCQLLAKMKSTKGKGILVSFIILLILLEFNHSPPFHNTDLSHIPEVYRWLAQREGDFIIAEYPLESYQGSGYYFLWQRIHKKRMVNGALPGTKAYQTTEKLVNLSCPETVKVLKDLEVKCLILHPERYLESDEVEVLGGLPALEENPDLKLVRTFPGGRVYVIKY
jgi:hypothetical protein